MLKFKIHCGWQNITERIRLSVFWMIYGALKGSYQMETSKRRYTAPDALKIRTVWTNLVIDGARTWRALHMRFSFIYSVTMGKLYSLIAQSAQSVGWAWLSRDFKENACRLEASKWPQLQKRDVPLDNVVVHMVTLYSERRDSVHKRLAVTLLR